ncbi:concanavalin A-like lectin/glucanase domain-containing protein [Pilobolus umbonatus]|nr:concanavalin A-like lectin/glucanase domain-containing protein [Pilobolus umbonatus]
MHITKVSVYALSLLSLAQSLLAVPTNKCVSGYTDFTKSVGGWVEIGGSKDHWAITNEGVQLKLTPPKEYIRLNDSTYNNKPHNKYTSPFAPNFKTNFLVHYGRVTFTMKTSNVPGVVSAAILIVNGGDEIDFEMLGGEPNKVQTNFYYGSKPVYGVNMVDHDLGTDLSDAFHKYTIDWSPQRIKFYFDDKHIRTVVKKDEKYPTHPISVQFSLWDASKVASTAEWAKGPIDWKKVKEATTIVKGVDIKCNPDYN